MELYRVDYTLLGLTNQNCVKLLPSVGSKLSQKVVVGDKEGVTTIFFIRKGEVQVTFKSLPGLPVTNVALGGSIGTTQDKVFVSSGNEVHGYTKKGKMFLNFETQLLENIETMYVSGSDLLVCGMYVYHHYLDCKLSDTYVSSDIINDMIPLNTLKVRRLITVLACNDQTIRVLDGSTVVQTHTFDDNPTRLYLLDGDLVLVGTKEGRIYLVHINRSGPIPVLWKVENEKHKSEITCITCFNILKIGLSDIIVGRQDGNVEVYTLIQTDDSGDYKPPVLKFTYSCNESVMSIQGGYVGNANFEEIAVTTYTGWFFGLTTEIPEKPISTNEHLEHNYGISKDEKQKIMKLRAEIEEIEAKVTKEREKYLVMTQDDSQAISRLPFLTISDKMSLNKEDASYTITLETETNIDNVLIQCDVPIKLMDVDKNSAVVSYSKCEQSSGNAILATYRCQLNTTRLELKFYITEGQKGTMLTYVTPLTQPKCCQLRTFPIKPLLLHFRNHNTEFVGPVNTLRLKGTFSLAEMHSWISQCLPDIPEKLPNEDKVEYLFESVLMGTMLKCTYERGEAEFKSNNISTISIVKDVITKEATKKKIRLDISSATDGDTIFSTLRTLNPQLEKYCRLERQLKILEALKDIDTAQSEPLSEYLTPEYKAILDNEQEILLQVKQNPFYLERLYNAVIDLFIDWHKYKGLSVKPKLSLFIDTLKERYSYEDICSYFTY